LEFKQESESKSLKCFGVGAELEYIQPKQEWSWSQKFQTPYISASQPKKQSNRWSSALYQLQLHIWPGSLFYCCYEFNLKCGVITSLHGLRLITVAEI